MAERIGMVGLGLLGAAIAERLLAAGFEVVGHDIDPQRGRELAALGGAAVGPEEIATCRRILLSLPSSAEVTTVVDALGPRLAAGSIVVDTTTGDPEASVGVGEMLRARGVSYLDATVVGSSAEARRGEVVVTAGGEPDAFAVCEDLFAAFARRWFRVGPIGSGSTTKLVINLVLGLNRAVLAEGLALSDRCGLEAPVVLAILKETAAYSRVMDSKGQSMVSGDFTPVARLSQHLKDVGLILDLGARYGADLPLSTVHRELLERARAAGFGEQDNSAIIRAFDP